MNSQLHINLCKQCGRPYKIELSQCPYCGSTDSLVVAPVEQIEGEEYQRLYGTVTEDFHVTDVDYHPVYKTDTNKRILPIVTAVIAALAITVGIVMYARHSIYENANLEVYKTGLAYYDDGDYENALSSLRGVQPDSRYFTQARDLMREVSEAYKSNLASQVETSVSGGDYDKAIRLIEEGSTVLPEDDEIQSIHDDTFSLFRANVIAIADGYTQNGEYQTALTYLREVISRFPDDLELQNAYNDTESAYRLSVHDTALNQAHEYGNEGNYVDAVRTLKNASEIFDDVELKAQLETYTNFLVESAIKEANAQYVKYDATSLFNAENIIGDALKLVPDNDRLKTEYHYYKENEPVSVFDMQGRTSGLFSHKDTAIDNRGVAHSNVYCVKNFVFDACDSHYPGTTKWRWYAYTTIDVDFQYSKITGVLFQTEKYKTASTESVFEVYAYSEGDWTSRRSNWGGLVSGNTDNAIFSVDISGQKFVTILFLGDYTSGKKDTEYDYAYLSDVYLWK